MKKQVLKRRKTGCRRSESVTGNSEITGFWPFSEDIGKRIDLHGKRRFQAREIVEAQLRSCRSEKCASVTFICGRGVHSPEGGVLEDEVKACLKDMKGYFRSYESDGHGNVRVYLEEK